MAEAFENSNSEQVPEALIFASKSASDAKYAGFWIRFVAALIDWVILTVAGVVISFIFAVIVGLTFGAPGGIMRRGPHINNLMFVVLGAIITWLYSACFESSRLQATFGKMIVGVYVTGNKGERLGFGAASRRYLAKNVGQLLTIIITFGLGLGHGVIVLYLWKLTYVLAAFHAEKRAVHDILAGTCVRRGSPPLIAAAADSADKV